MDSVIVHSIWCLLSSFSLSYKVNIKIYTKPRSYRPKDTNISRQIALETKFCNAAFNICGSSVCVPPLWCQKCEVVPIFLEHLYTPVL